MSLSDCQTQEKKVLGNKRKEDNSHNKSGFSKYSDDNTRRKIKRLIISELLDFINKKIEEKYDFNIGNGMLKKKLIKINQEQIINTVYTFYII